MNREIKFRVWDPKNKNFLRSYKDRGLSFSNASDEQMEQFGCYDLEQCIDFGFVIQQYTGLKDKNNIEVYEGDIVKINRCYTRPFVDEKQQIEYKFIDDGEVEVGQVLWGWNVQKYLVSYDHIRHDDVEDFDKSSHRVEVIGNIFEPPCNPDHNGECLICDCWLSDCPLRK